MGAKAPQPAPDRPDQNVSGGSPAPPPPGPDSTPEYLEGFLLVLAVGDVFLSNVAAETRDPNRPKASADAWVWHSSLRKDIFTRTVDRWVSHSGFSILDFPFSQDAVAKVYLKYRKRSFEQANAIRAAAASSWAKIRSAR